MFDKDLTVEVLEQIQSASQTILERFAPVNTVSDLTASPEGREKLDSICMLLIALGEALKKLDKITNASITNHPMWYTLAAWRSAPMCHTWELNPPS